MKKKVIITEKQYNYILDRLPKMEHLTSLIREELSINIEVETCVNSVLSEIDKQIKLVRKEKIDDGICRQSFQIEPFKLNEYVINIAVTNIDFKDRKTYENQFPKYKQFIIQSTTSPMVKVHKFYLYIHTCSISGGLRKNIAGDNLQHEIEHVFQMSMTGSELPKEKNENNNYTTAFSTINTSTNTNSLDYIIALCLYYSYPFEQDGYVNGLYQYLDKSEIPLITMDDVLQTQTCKAFFQLKDYLNTIKNSDINEIEKILVDKYNLHYNKFIKIIDRAVKRFGKKIGKVLALHWREAIKKGTRINESFDNNIFYFV